jgi:tetratricopeptide (TPR) repeat protein
MAKERLVVYDTKTKTWKKSAIYDVLDFLSGAKQILEQARHEVENGSSLSLEQLIKAIKKRREVLLKEFQKWHNELFFGIERDFPPSLLGKLLRTKIFLASQAVSFLRKDLHKECIEALSLALEKDPCDIRLLLARGIRFAVNTPWDYESAINDFEAVLLLDHQNQLANFCLGVIYYALADNAKARTCLTESSQGGSVESINEACERMFRALC